VSCTNQTRQLIANAHLCLDRRRGKEAARAARCFLGVVRVKHIVELDDGARQDTWVNLRIISKPGHDFNTEKSCHWQWCSRNTLQKENDCDAPTRRSQLHCVGKPNARHCSSLGKRADYSGTWRLLMENGCSVLAPKTPMCQTRRRPAALCPVGRLIHSCDSVRCRSVTTALLRTADSQSSHLARHATRSPAECDAARDRII
jgi:hypothetical protein